MNNSRVQDYYETIRPFYEAEMACRDDISDWVALARRSTARWVVDLGCGGGRVTRALRPTLDAVGIDLLTTLLPPGHDFPFVLGDLRDLPFRDRAFDLGIAANDPFVHLLTDEDRSRALAEATRVARSVVIDGLRLTADDDARARGGGLLREQALTGDIVRRECWTALGEDRYRTTYRYVRDGGTLAEASAEVRAWRVDEPSLRRADVRLHGGLDAGPFDPERSGFVIEIGEQ